MVTMQLRAKRQTRAHAEVSFREARVWSDREAMQRFGHVIKCAHQAEQAHIQWRGVCQAVGLASIPSDASGIRDQVHRAANMLSDARIARNAARARLWAQVLVCGELKIAADKSLREACRRAGMSIVSGGGNIYSDWPIRAESVAPRQGVRR